MTTAASARKFAAAARRHAQTCSPQSAERAEPRDVGFRALARLPLAAMPTPHERRVLENAARRRVVSDLESLIRSSPGTVPAADVLATFERASAPLPADSKLLATFQGLSERLRRQGSG